VSRSDSSGGFAATVAAGVVVVVGLIVGLIGMFTGWDKTTGGEVGVVRNGGVFDNNKIRQVIQPASSLTWTGFWSSTHKYPARQRNYTITADARRGDRTGVDVLHVPSNDGVDLGIEGTIYFTLNLDKQAMERFDDKFGTRQFRGLDGNLRSAWDGDDGWSTFLDAIVRPVIDNDMRIQVGEFRCVDLLSSCALVQNQAAGTVAPTAASSGKANNTNIGRVQDSVNTSLKSDLTSKLGGEFFEDIQFNLSRVTLPPNVQGSVDRAQANFADITGAQAKVAVAQAEADANKKRQDGYNACPACAQIDIIKALPPGVTVYAPGSNSAVPLAK
jgi:hypothetical protein